MPFRRWVAAFVVLTLLSTPFAGLARAFAPEPQQHHCCPRPAPTAAAGSHNHDVQDRLPAGGCPLDCGGQCLGCQHCTGAAVPSQAAPGAATVPTDAFVPAPRAGLPTFISPVEPRPPRRAA